jgi:glutathione S-transferase
MAGKIILFGRPSSLNTQRVLWALHECKVPFDMKLTSATMGATGKIDGSKTFGNVDDPEFLRASPFRQIPAIIDGDAALWESASIIRYLAAKYCPELCGDGDEARKARQSAWMDYHLSTFAAGAMMYSSGDFMGNLITHLVRLPVDGSEVDLAFHGKVITVRRCSQTAEQAGAVAAREFGKVDAFLTQAGSSYLGGDAFSIADIPLGTEVNRWMLLRGRLATPPPATPALDAWYAKLLEREAFREAVLAHEKAHQEAP